MRAGCAAALLHEVFNDFDKLRLCGIGGDIEDEDLAVRQPGRPELAPIVGEAAMMGFMPPADRGGEDRLPKGRRVFARIDGDELVRPIAQALDPQRPDVDEILDAGNLGHIG